MSMIITLESLGRVQGNVLSREPDTAYNPSQPITHVGIVTYDGAGNFSGQDKIMLNGALIPDTFSGTYTVTEDCMIAGRKAAHIRGSCCVDTFTGTYTVTKGCMISVEVASTAVGVIHEVGWIVGDGESTEVRLILTDPGFLAFDAARKQ